MIRKVELIPTTETSRPFVEAFSKCAFQQRGYTEKEYRMEGTANVYCTLENGEVGIRFPDAPYINRFVVRAPEAPGKASGNVVVEILNPTSDFDIDRMWILGREEFMRSGDIYVGITSKPNVLPALKAARPERYADLEWKNPTAHDPLPIPKGAHGYSQEYETGLFWDMLTDLARLLKSDDTKNPLAGYPCERLVLTGWSQSGCYLIRYVNSIVYNEKIVPDGCPYDGFLSAGAPRGVIVPLNQYEYFTHHDLTEGRIYYSPKPYMAVQTESDNAELKSCKILKRDSDVPGFLYRMIEIAGPSHDTMDSYVYYYDGDEDLKKIHQETCYCGLHERGNDYPYHFHFHAAYRHLFDWIRTGTGPVSIDRIKLDAKGKNMRDALGNSIGGARSCLLDYPTAAYYYYSNIKAGDSFLDPNATVDIIRGHEEVFPAEMIRYMYHTLDHYRELITANTAEHVQKGHILKDDAEAVIALALSYAKERGLD